MAREITVYGAFAYIHVENRVNDLVAFDAQDRRAKDLFRLSVDDDLRLEAPGSPCAALVARDRPFAISYRPTSAFLPDLRTWASVMPQRPSGGSI